MADNSSPPLPREALLLKCLNMTTVKEDSVAVVAIRQANKILADAGWSWEKLLSAKITVIGDPFANIPAPPQPARAAPPPPRSATRSAPPPPSPNRTTAKRPTFGDALAAMQAAQEAQQKNTSKPYSTQPNRYGGSCYCCADLVASGVGFVFQPHKYNNRAPVGKWEIICDPCNGKASIYSVKAPSRNKPLHASINPDLNSL